MSGVDGETCRTLPPTTSNTKKLPDASTATAGSDVLLLSRNTGTATSYPPAPFGETSSTSPPYC